VFAPACFGPPERSSGTLCWALLKLQFFLWNWSVKIHRYMICGVVCDCSVYCVPCSVRPSKSYNDVFLLINSTKKL